jgi:hypothetical protein
MFKSPQIRKGVDGSLSQMEQPPLIIFDEDQPQEQQQIILTFTLFGHIMGPAIRSVMLVTVQNTLHASLYRRKLRTDEHGGAFRTLYREVIFARHCTAPPLYGRIHL